MISQEQSSQEVEPYVHPEGANILPALDEDQVKRLTNSTIEGFEHDLESCRDYLDRQALYQRLYFMTDTPKDRPWPDSATESIPIVTEAVNQFANRALQNLFPGPMIVKCLPMGALNEPIRRRMDRVSKHMSWQLTIKDRGYSRNKDALLQRTALYGSYFTETFYDPIYKRVVVQNVRSSSLILQYNIETCDIADIPRKTRLRYLPLVEGQILSHEGYLAETPKPFNGEEYIPAREAQDRNIGTQEASGESELGLLLEQHTLCDLDGDGLPEPYIITLDRSQNKILRVALRYETDAAGNPIKHKRPVERFTHYFCLPNPDGFYGIGFGHLLGPINSGTNKMLRATLDAAYLANAGNMSGFVSKSVSLGKGAMKMTIGNFKATNASPEDLQRGIWQPKFPGPNQALISMMQFLTARGDRLGSVTEMLTGTADKVLQPTTAMGLIEQGLQQFSAIYKRVAESLTDELLKIYALNYKHLDPVESFTLQSAENRLEGMEAYRTDYAPDMMVLPISDPKQVTEQQKLQRAQMQWQFLMQNPLVMQSPQHLHAASVRMAKALEIEDISEVIPNPGTSQFPPIDDPMIENAILLQTGAMPMAMMPQQHDAHIAVHTQLVSDPAIGPSRTAAIFDHIRTHQRLKAMAANASLGQAPLGQPSSVQGLLDGTPNVLPAGGGMDPSGQMGTDSQIAGPSGSPGMDQNMDGNSGI